MERQTEVERGREKLGWTKMISTSTWRPSTPRASSRCALHTRERGKKRESERKQEGETKKAREREEVRGRNGAIESERERESE